MTTAVETQNGVVHNNNSINVLKKSSPLKDKLCMIGAEFLGTLLLILFGCMGTIDWIQMPGLPILAPLNFGLTVGFVIQIIGHISFAIINPAVAIAAAVHKLIGIRMMFVYMVVETLGAAAGYGILKALTPCENFQSGLCMTLPQQNVSTVQLFFIEFMLTFALVLVVSGAWDARNRDNTDSVALRIGFTVAALGFAGSQATGASMNPARSFGPALWNWNWSFHWVFWVAPMCGSLCASVLYRAVFWRPNPKDILEDTHKIVTSNGI